MASSPLLNSLCKSTAIFSIFLAITISPSSALPSSSTAIALCKSTPHPNSCLNSLKLSVSININPLNLNFLLQILETALSEAQKVSDQFSRIVNTAAGTGHSTDIVLHETQKGTIKDCQELQQITVSSVKKSLSLARSLKNDGARTFLSAALTNKAACLEALESASGASKSILVNSMIDSYKHVANALSVVSKQSDPDNDMVHHRRRRRRRLMSVVPKWLSKRDLRFLQSSGDDDDDDEYDPGHVVTVAGDGSGNFTTLSEAINFAPNNSYERTLIYVKSGVYRENLEIPTWKTNIVLIGDGSDSTVITGNRSVGDGWTTFRSATVAVSGEGFLARDITFENTAGAEKRQAVALRVNADLSAFYRCAITGYQDSLYVHTFRQFYRECDVKGTIDYIFGNAGVIFQGCNLISRMPLPGQFTVMTAQSRDNLDENTGISIQNCSILPTEDLFSNSATVKSYLERPWRNYSRTVVIDSYVDDFVDPLGWIQWSVDETGAMNTLYYGEYNNNGPGSDTGNRVSWEGYHVMDYYDASNFTVSAFIAGDEWLDSTSFPYDNDI